jgi:hypothetical protein
MSPKAGKSFLGELITQLMTNKKQIIEEYILIRGDTSLHSTLV